MGVRCAIACKLSSAAAGLSLLLAGCASAPSPSHDLLAFEPGDAPLDARVAKVDVESPIRRICALPGGHALLDRELPGLTARPEFPMFNEMSLLQLKRLSGGRITTQMLARVAVGLRELNASAAAMRAAPQPRRVTTSAQASP